MKTKKVLYWLLPIFLFLMITFISYPYLFSQFSQKIPLGDSPDVFYILSIINHSQLAPISEIYHLPYYYPKPYTTTYGHPLFGITVFFKIFEFAGLTLTQSNNLYIIFCLVCGAFGCYLLARDMSGHAPFSFAFASFYILFAGNRTDFGTINLLSHYLPPFIFYFFIRFFKDKKKYNAIIASFLCFYFFFTEIYYGIHLWVLILPAFLLLAVIFRICSWRELKFILLNLFIASLLVLVVYFPFLIQIGKEHLTRDFNSAALLHPQQIFYGNTLMALVLGKPHGGTHLFPGMLFSLAVLMFFASGLGALKKPFPVIMFFYLMLLSYFYYANPFLLELGFFVLIIILALLALVGHEKMNAIEKVMLLTFAIFFLLMLYFSQLPLLKSFIVYKYLFKLVPGMSGLRAVSRVVIPMGLPFLISIAAVGFSNFIAPARPMSMAYKIKPLVLSLGLIAVMYFENVSSHYPMHSLPRNEVIYERIPFNKNKIILEFPWDYGFNKYYLNGLYMLNWSQHQNFILNGRSAFFPDRYVDDLYKILGSELKQFPHDEQLKQLIEKYGVTHVIFHWELIRRFYAKPRKVIATLKENISKISDFGRTLDMDKNHLILQLGEMNPVSRLARTYSYNHLRYHSIMLALSEPYLGKVVIQLNGQTIRTISGDSSFMQFDFKKEKLRNDKNMIAWEFEKPVQLKVIEIQ